MKTLAILGVAMVALSVTAGTALATDPIPGVDVKLGKNPGGSVQTTGDGSPVSTSQEATVSVSMQDDSTQRIGGVKVTGSSVGMLTSGTLSATVSGNAIEDGNADDADASGRRVAVTSGTIGSTFAAPGVTNAQQNTGQMGLVQGQVIVGMGAPSN